MPSFGVECFVGESRHRRVGCATIAWRRGQIHVGVNAGRKLEPEEAEAISRLFEAAEFATKRLGGRAGRGRMLWQLRESGGASKGVSAKIALGLATRLNAAVGGEV